MGIDERGHQTGLNLNHEKLDVDCLVKDHYDTVYEKQMDGSLKKIGKLIDGRIMPDQKLRKKERKRLRNMIAQEVHEAMEEKRPISNAVGDTIKTEIPIDVPNMEVVK